MSNVVLITGASSGIGRATALELARAGHTVYASARRVKDMSDIGEAGGHVLPMDVTSAEDRNRAVQTVFDEQGRIDALVNNAGYGLYGAAEDVPLEQARQQFEVNLFGPAALIQLVLPHMRAQRSGRIVNMSSMGGEITLPLGAWYHASKHALEAYSDALRQEVGGFGIHVVLIRPGVIKTDFANVMNKSLLEISGQGAYKEMAEGMAKSAETAYGPESKATDPSVVAETVRKAIEASKPKTRYTVGYMARPMMALNTVLPDRIFDRIAARQVE